MNEPSHTQIRQAIAPLFDPELDAWTLAEASYVLQPFNPAHIGEYGLWQLSPAGASRPIGIVLACQDRTGVVHITSDNAEAVAEVMAGMGPLDPQPFAETAHALWMPVGRAQQVVPASAYRTQDATGPVTIFDVHDEFNGVETWVVRLEPGNARVDTLGVA